MRIMEIALFYYCVALSSCEASWL